MAYQTAEDGSSLLQRGFEDSGFDVEAVPSPWLVYAGTRKISKISTVVGVALCLGILGTISLYSLRGQVPFPGSTSSSEDAFEMLLERRLFDVSLFDDVGVPYSTHPEEAKVRKLFSLPLWTEAKRSLH